MSVQERATNGLKVLLGTSQPFSQVQGAWRFLNNKNVTTPALWEPIFENLKQEVQTHCQSFVLAMSDWSHLDYKKHSAKKELITKNKKNNTKQIGYDLQTTIAVSDVDGVPIAPIVHNLKTRDKVYSTYNDRIDSLTTHLDELAQRATWINQNLSTTKSIVHIVDRESDSVAFMRDMQQNNNLFVLRVKENSKLYYPKEQRDFKQSELAQMLPLGKEVQTIQYKKSRVRIYVNECMVKVRRDATRMVENNGKRQIEKIASEPIKARFIVERLVDNEGKILAEWLLLSNILDETVSAQTLAKWYYYRWKIESVP